jgi:Molecular chaperone, HSP90 family
MENNGFKIKFDKNTIDHLGIKLYSSFPPVIAELISNSYDADAENVEIRINYEEKIVTVIDNGTGMTHDELNQNFLVIGRNRRKAEGTGISKVKSRKVTGKKGLGKLAVFGIAKTIEVYSVKDDVKNAFSINYDDMKAETDAEYRPRVICENENTREKSGTVVKIKEIKQSTIMSIEDLAYNLSRRFSFYDAEFEVKIIDEKAKREQLITKSIYFDKLEKEFEWTFPEDFANEINNVDEFKRLNEHFVTGKIYTKSTPLRKKDSGFLLYVRNKLASENVFFDDRANDRFNGYVTGFFNIDFIDDSDEDDYISTARQSILWEENENTTQLKHDLNRLVSKISALWRESRKKKKEEQLQLPENFFEGMSKLEISSINKVKDTLIANSIETDNIDSLKRILDSMKTLYKFESFQNYIAELDDEDLTVDKVEKITADWEYIESKELAKISIGRIKAIEQFERYVRNDASETKVIQPFLEKFPWILDPRITTFEREVTFKEILKNNFPDSELEERNRRLDFLCNLVNGELIIIELKRPRIKISFKEIRQARDYERFLLKNHKESIANGVKTFLISDSFEMDEETKDFYSSLEATNKLCIKSYSDLLQQAKQYNKDYITRYKEIESIYNPDRTVSE